MKNDFRPVVGHGFNLRADWGAVDCKVLAVEPNKKLSYTWDAMGLESVITWTLTPTSTGTHLRMEQSGFRPDQQQAYQGAKFGWQKFFANLEQVLAREEERRLRQLAVSAAFAHRANTAAPSDMWFPTTAELLSEHVATQVVKSAN